MNSPILEPILVGIESDVHWGYDLAFDPWPNALRGASPHSCCTVLIVEMRRGVMKGAGAS